MSPFAFLQNEWPPGFKAASKAKGAVRADRAPRVTTLAKARERKGDA